MQSSNSCNGKLERVQEDMSEHLLKRNMFVSLKLPFVKSLIQKEALKLFSIPDVVYFCDFLTCLTTDHYEGLPVH